MSRAKIKVVDHELVEEVIERLASSPGLVSKEAAISPLEARALHRFKCNERHAFSSSYIFGDNTQVRARLVRMGYVTESHSGVSLTSDGHHALHNFLDQHWRQVMPESAQKSCGGCGTVVTFGADHEHTH